MRAWHWLVAICLLAFGTGLVVGVSAGSEEVRSSIYAGVAWVLYIFVYRWMKVDARERSVTPPPGALPLIVGLFLVAIPYYLLGTRRRWHKLSSVGLLCVYVVVALSCSIAGELLGGTLMSSEHAGVIEA